MLLRPFSLMDAKISECYVLSRYQSSCRNFNGMLVSVSIRRYYDHVFGISLIVNDKKANILLHSYCFSAKKTPKESFFCIFGEEVEDDNPIFMIKSVFDRISYGTYMIFHDIGYVSFASNIRERVIIKP